MAGFGPAQVGTDYWNGPLAKPRGSDRFFAIPAMESLMAAEVSSWKERLRAARLATLASLTPEEAAERMAADAAERAARAERRGARIAKALLINQRAALGDKPQEIAARLGISMPALRARGRRWGHALVQRAGFRRLSAWVADRHVRALDALSADAGVSREKALEAILAAVLGEGATIARRIVAPAKKRAASGPSKLRSIS